VALKKVQEDIKRQADRKEKDRRMEEKRQSNVEHKGLSV